MYEKLIILVFAVQSFGALYTVCVECCSVLRTNLTIGFAPINPIYSHDYLKASWLFVNDLDPQKSLP
jgi:hypothetical protein